MTYVFQARHHSLFAEIFHRALKAISLEVTSETRNLDSNDALEIQR